MPNVKVYVGQALFDARRAAIAAALPGLRARLCETLSVSVPACQIAVVPVLGLEGQPQANLELGYLAKPDRTPAIIAAHCETYRAFLTGPLGTAPAVRATPLDPDTYVALKD